MNLVFADQVRDREILEQDLDDGEPSLAGRTLEQVLRDDAAQQHREDAAHLLSRLLRGRVNDAVDGRRGAVGVERTEHEHTGLRRGERQLDGLQVAHLAHDDHIGRLPQG